MIFCSRSHTLSHCRPQAQQPGKRVARVKRSETRGSLSIVPGLRFASPGPRTDPPRKAGFTVIVRPRGQRGPRRATRSAPRPQPSRLAVARTRDDGVRCVTFSLTLVPFSDTDAMNLAQLQDGSRVTPAAGASAVPAGGGSSLSFSGGSGKTPGRHHDRSARSSLDWDRRDAVNACKSHVPGSACWS
jgi:hypothetical protein